MQSGGGDIRLSGMRAVGESDVVLGSVGRESSISRSSGLSGLEGDVESGAEERRLSSIDTSTLFRVDWGSGALSRRRASFLSSFSTSLVSNTAVSSDYFWQRQGHKL